MLDIKFVRENPEKFGKLYINIGNPVADIMS